MRKHQAMLAGLMACAVLALGADEPTTKPASDGVLEVRFISIEKTSVGQKITVELLNVSGKPIEAIKGGVSFYDRFGDRIGVAAAAVAIDKAMPLGGKYLESGVWPLIDKRALDLLASDPEKVTLVWKTSRVAYGEK